MKPSDDLDTNVRRVLAQALQSAIWPADAAGDAPALTIAPAAKPKAPAKLAAAHGGSAKAQQIYERCLAMYRAKLRPDDKADDLGAAVAFFVLVNYLAFHRSHFDDRAGLIDAEPEALVGQIARQLQHQSCPRLSEHATA